MKHKLLVIFAFSLFVTGCKRDKPSTTDTPSITKELKKDISELSYMEVYYALFTDNNGGFDAHGDLYGQAALSDLIINSENSDCGNGLFLQNNSDKSIVLAVKASFNLSENPVHEMTRAYTIKPTDTLSLGNSLLCYDGKEYPIKRDIISAGYSTESK